jgi:ferredoxin
MFVASMRRVATQLPRHARPSLRAQHAASSQYFARRRALCTSTETVSLTFIEDGEEVMVDAEIGKTLLEVAHDNEIDLEGACDGSLACSTCHVILEEGLFDELPLPEEEEEDMLDLAFGLTETSRLGCQIKVDKSFEGTVVRLPDGSYDLSPPS